MTTGARGKVERPWGSYEVLYEGHRYQVKVLHVNCGAALSLQYHHHRSERWNVVRGTAHATVGEETCRVGEGEWVNIPVGAVHRLANNGKIPLEVVEVQWGSYLGEDDIVRLEDRYGRESPPPPERREDV